ncbi:SRPBCC family protein [Halobacillus massiliensis]|uniref:SRPBCC family protein n=1 Tax=Halobacillus massiliensis TaxID=1926286 RepID=UPI0009E35F26|nr:SRPBCC domain-containing protein [Halobacillus massiliensis]
MSQNQTVEEIRKQVIFNAPVEKVWEAVASSEGMAEWFMPNNFKAEEGHEFYLESPFETSACKVLTVKPPKEITFSWGTQGWIVHFLLEEINGKTEFTLIHSGWGHPEEKMRPTGKTHQETRNTMDGGWESIVKERLRKAVEQ